MQNLGHRKSGALYAGWWTCLVNMEDSRMLEMAFLFSALKLEGVEPSANIFCVLANAYAQQVPDIYEKMESAGCTPGRKAKEMLQTAQMVLEQRKQ